MSKDPSLLTSTIGDSSIVISESPLKGLQKQMVDAQVSQKILEAEIIALEEAMQREFMIPDVIVQQSLDEHREIQNHLARISEKNAMIAEIATRSAQGDEDPASDRLRSEITSLEESIRQITERAFMNQKVAA